MTHAQAELYAGQPVVCGGKPTFVQFARAGLVWLVGFAHPIQATAVEQV